MVEQIHNDYEHSSGPVMTIAVPYARLTDATPTPSNPCELVSVLAGTQLCGTIMTVDAGDSIAIVNVAPGFIGNWEVRNVLTYKVGAEDTWGAINYGDPVYYDHSATMPAGVYLSIAPAGADAVANTLFGHVACKTSEAAALYPKGAGGVASTQDCQVQQRGAGA